MTNVQYKRKKQRSFIAPQPVEGINYMRWETSVERWEAA